MIYSKNDIIRAYPNPTRDAHYTCMALEDNGNVIQTYPTQSNHIFENVVDWVNSIPQCADVAPRMIVQPYKESYRIEGEERKQ